MSIVHFTTHLGEPAELRRTPEDHWVCPVCGDEWEYPPDADPVLLVDSLDMCDGCDTEFGNDDIPSVPPPKDKPIMERWAELRIAWLNRTGWPDESLKRLRENLSIDVDRLRREGGR